MSDPNDDPNLRREARVSVNMPVRIATIDPETDPGTGKPFFRSSTELCSNVSRTGLFVRTAEPLQPGRRLLVEMNLPSGDSVEAVGRVAWVKRRVSPETERGVGIELVGGVPEQLESLQAFVSKRDRRRGPGGPASIG